MLHGVQVPSKGGETRFCNMHRAYDDLPKELRNRINGLCGIHRITARRQKTGRITYSKQEYDAGPTGIHP